MGFLQCCPKSINKPETTNYIGTLSKDHEEYKSNVISKDLVNDISEIKIKPKIFINENTSLPTDHYEKVNIVGEGSYGTVLKVLHTKSNEFRAMKIIKKSNINF